MILFGSLLTTPSLDPEKSPLDSKPFLSPGPVAWAWLYWKLGLLDVRRWDSFKVGQLSSEFLVRFLFKRNPAMALLLAAYYNFYSPSYRYYLLSQGSPREGDKKSFLQADIVVGTPFHKVDQRGQVIGHQTGEKLPGSATLRSDPRWDYSHHEQRLVQFKYLSFFVTVSRYYFIYRIVQSSNLFGNLFGIE